MKLLAPLAALFLSIAGCAATAEGVATGAAELRTACEATSPRPARLEIVVTPDDGDARVVGLLAGASTSIDVTIYQLSAQRILTALEAAAGRGVRVRVIQEGEQARPATIAALRAAGVEFHTSPETFLLTHQKTITIDHRTTFVFSGNFDRNGFNGGRNYGVIDEDADDVADFEELFDADWNERAASLPCTRLVVSPVNARARLLALIAGAKRSLDIETMYISDRGIEAAVVAAEERGVAVRVLFNDPDHGIGDATPSARRLGARGIPVRRSGAFFIHAKVIVADDTYAFVGSENFSAPSLDKNREAGIVVSTSDADLTRITGTFTGDWSRATAFVTAE